MRALQQQFRHFEMPLIPYSTQCLNSGKYLQTLISRTLLSVTANHSGAGGKWGPALYVQIGVWQRYQCLKCAVTSIPGSGCMTKNVIIRHDIMFIGNTLPLSSDDADYPH